MKDKCVNIVFAMEKGIRAKTNLSRIVAMFLDFAIVILCSFLVKTFADTFVKNQGKVKENIQLRTDALKETHLLKYDDSDKTFSYFNDKELFTKEDDEFLIINRLAYFYIDYLGDYNVKSFNSEILRVDEHDYYVKNEGRIATFDTEKITEKDEIKKEVVTFTHDTYRAATKKALNLKTVLEAERYVEKISHLTFAIIYFIFIVIFFTSVPFIHFSGETLGQRIMKLRVLSSTSNPILSWKQIILRNALLYSLPFYFYFVNGFASLIYPLLLIGVSLLVLVLVRKDKSLLDFIGDTKVVLSTNMPIDANNDKI